MINLLQHINNLYKRKNNIDELNKLVSAKPSGEKDIVNRLSRTHILKLPDDKLHINPQVWEWNTQEELTANIPMGTANRSKLIRYSYTTFKLIKKIKKLSEPGITISEDDIYELINKYDEYYGDMGNLIGNPISDQLTSITQINTNKEYFAKHKQYIDDNKQYVDILHKTLHSLYFSLLKNINSSVAKKEEEKEKEEDANKKLENSDTIEGRLYIYNILNLPDDNLYVNPKTWKWGTKDNIDTLKDEEPVHSKVFRRYSIHTRNLIKNIKKQDIDKNEINMKDLKSYYESYEWALENLSGKSTSVVIHDYNKDKQEYIKENTKYIDLLNKNIKKMYDDLVFALGYGIKRRLSKDNIMKVIDEQYIDPVSWHWISKTDLSQKMKKETSKYKDEWINYSENVTNLIKTIKKSDKANISELKDVYKSYVASKKEFEGTSTTTDPAYLEEYSIKEYLKYNKEYINLLHNNLSEMYFELLTKLDPTEAQKEKDKYSK